LDASGSRICSRVHLHRRLRGQSHLRARPDPDHRLQAVPAEDPRRSHGEDQVNTVALLEAAANPERRLGEGMAQDRPASPLLEHELDPGVPADVSGLARVGGWS
jgi:hypothetical protein